MYKTLPVMVVIGFVNVSYWSSTEFDNNFVWIQVFVSGFQGINLKKSGSLRVRAVRAF